MKLNLNDQLSVSVRSTHSLPLLNCPLFQFRVHFLFSEVSPKRLFWYESGFFGMNLAYCSKNKQSQIILIARDPSSVAFRFPPCRSCAGSPTPEPRMARKIIDPNQTNRCQRVPTSVVTLKFTKVESYRGHRVSHDGIAVIQTLLRPGSAEDECR